MGTFVPYLSSSPPRAFAHRGWHVDELDGFENSLAAFRRATDEGYRYLETDVHATADGVLVVHHDPTLDRTTDRSGAIAELPWSEVRRAKINGVEPVCRLEDVLEELPEAHLNVDVKADQAAEPFVDVVRRTGAFDRVAAASFSTRRLARIGKLAGAALTLAMDPRSTALTWLSGRASFLPVRTLVRGAMAQVPRNHRGLPVVDASFVRAAHRFGAEVHVWTVDDADQMRLLLDIGVDGLITDRPDVLRAVLVERGTWPDPTASEEPCPSTPPSTSSGQDDRSP